MSNDSYTGNYTLDDYASSTVDLIAALNLGTPDILGTSLGSLITQTIVVNHSSAVTHAVLGDTALTGPGLLTIPNPVSTSNVFVAAGGTPAADQATRTYPYNIPAGLAGLCRAQNLTSYNPVDKATSAQLAQQATVQSDIEGAGGDQVSAQALLHKPLPGQCFPLRSANTATINLFPSIRDGLPVNILTCHFNIANTTPAEQNLARGCYLLD